MNKRKIFAVALSAMALAFASCQKEDSDTLTFTAQTETSTKTAMNGQGYFEWENSDQVEIYSASNHATFSVMPRSTDPTWADLRGHNIGAAPYTAIFPASIASPNFNNVVYLPRNVHSSDGGLRNVPMMATSNNHHLGFTNLCSAVRICIPAGTRNISKIEVAADKLICGTSTIATGTDGMPYAATPTFGSRIITMEIDNPAAQSNNNDRYYYISIPAGTYQYLTFYFFDENGQVASRTLSNSITLHRSQYSTIRIGSDLEFSEVAHIKQKMLWMDYSITKVEFHYNSNVTSNTRIDTINNVPVYLVYENNTEMHIHTPAPILDASTSTYWLFFALNNCTSIELNDGFRVDDATNFGNMFFGCKFSSIDLSTFNIKHAVNYGAMFTQCINLTSVDLSFFPADANTYAQILFIGCTNLSHIELGRDFNLSAANNQITASLANIPGVCTIHCTETTAEAFRQTGLSMTPYEEIPETNITFNTTY